MDRIENFSKAWKEFTADPHVYHASIGITILDSRTGSILFEHAKDVGLAPASNTKTITAAAALHYLGGDYTYQTVLEYSGKIDVNTGFLDGYIYIVGSGDPSLGSWRYDETVTAESIIEKWIDAIKQAGIKKCRGIVGDPSRWNSMEQMLIDGWTWHDLGHWHGTGHSALNWRENEFSIEIQPGPSINTPARLIKIRNPPPRLEIINELVTSSVDDNGPSLHFSLTNPNVSYLRGYVSIETSPNFTLRCAVPNSALYAAHELTQALGSAGIEIEEEATIGSSKTENAVQLHIHHSPPLAKLLQPFLRISINMYGEVFVKTIAHHTGQCSLNDAPLTVLPTYIKTLFNTDTLLSGVAIRDGSGLSRASRLTTYALAQILFQIQKESWFNDQFFEALPIIGGLKMKSGTLMNTVAYAGYIPENFFVFSFMINNYHGEDVTNMRKKIWDLLGKLK